MDNFLTREEIFRSLLFSRGIGEFSPAIPEGIGIHIHGVPLQEDLHVIPESEQFPLEEVPKNDLFEKKKLRDIFVKAQAAEIARSRPYHSRVQEEIIGNSTGIGDSFEKIEDFARFKEEINAFCIKKSHQYEFSTPIIVCSEVSCLNSSVPGFSHCINHLHMDPKFTKQKLIGQCSHQSEDGSICGKPCSIKHKQCSYHRSLHK